MNHGLEQMKSRRQILATEERTCHDGLRNLALARTREHDRIDQRFSYDEKRLESQLARIRREATQIEREIDRKEKALARESQRRRF